MSDSKQSKKLIIELPKSPLDSDSYKNITTLDLTTNEKYEFQLTNINRLDEDQYRKVYKNILTLNVSNNVLSYMRLKNYNFLDTLLASNNQISRVDLHLNSLKVLDLSKNNITEMFELIDLPSLKELILNQNSLTDINYDSFKYVKSTLTKLDISENLISFDESKSFFNFCKTFGSYMKELTVLNVGQNPFTEKKKYKDNYFNYLVGSFGKLMVLNGKDIGLEKTKFKNVDSANEILRQLKEKISDLEKKENSYASSVTKGKPTNITLKTLNAQLLKINQLGRLNEKTFDDFEDMVDMYLNSDVGGGLIEIDENVDEELDDFEIFLDYIEKIIDGISGFEKRIYEILGKFSIVKYGKFASRSLSCIKQRISSNNTDDIVPVLSIVYNFLRKTPEENIPISIIDSVSVFLNEANFKNVMKTILKRIIVLSLKIYKEVRFDFLSEDTKNNLLSLYNAFIQFIALSVDNGFSDVVIFDDFIESCSYNIKRIFSDGGNLIFENEIVLNLLKNYLRIIKSLCLEINAEEIEKHKNKNAPDNQDEPKDTPDEDGAAKKKKLLDLLVGSGIRDRIEQKLPELLQSVYRKEDLSDNSRDMSNRKKMFLKKTHCVSLIQTLGAFLSCAPDVTKFLQSNSITTKILTIISQNEIICPLLISGACDFTYYLLINPNVNQNEKNFSFITSRIYNLRCLLPYLFPNREEFYTICAICEKYFEKTLDRGKVIDLNLMNSQILNQLFISITRLMSIFGKFSRSNSPVSKQCINVCAEMNKMSRDTALTNVLLIPNDDVKLSVVKCFFTIPSEELEPEELTAIYKQLTYVSSLTPKMQVIISIVYIIMNKWFLFNLQLQRYKNIETCKEAIFLAMDLLYRNDFSRKTAYEQLTKVRTNLSAILIMFLINVSAFSYTKKYFNSPKNTNEMIRVLQKEEECVEIGTSIGFPLEIEKCHCGWNVSNIVNAIRGGVINPYNYVSLRIMIHLGNVLMNIPYQIYKCDYNEGYESIFTQTVEEMKTRERERISNESLNWRNIEIIKAKLNKIVSSSVSQEGSDKCFVRLANEEEILNEQKCFVRNFNTILEFVLGQCSEKQISQYSKIWETKFNNDIDRIHYSILNEPIELNSKGDFSYQEKLKYESGTPTGKTSTGTPSEQNEDDSDVDEENIYESFKNYLRCEDYNSSSKKESISGNYIQNELMHYSRYGHPDLHRDSDEETPNNPYLRSLFISAFFRCIYAILEHSQDKSIKEELITTLYQKDNIRILCCLTECTKFAENNISTKFLIISRHILRNSALFKDQFNEVDRVKRKDEISIDYLNKIGQISYIIRKILAITKKELNIEKDEHKIFLSEICQCSAIIISQLQMMRFINDGVQEKTLSTMIDYELINVFIYIIKEYMNKVAEADPSSSVTNNELLNEMISINTKIIGEYMARCKSKKYDILELFTRSYMFDRCKMRKSLIKEIISNEEICNAKAVVAASIGNNNINFLSPGYITNYRSGSARNRLVVITDTAIEFLEIDDISSFTNSSYFNIDDSARVNIDSITSVLKFDYQNRLVLQTRDNEIGIFFYKTIEGKEFCSVLNEINNKIVYYGNVELFPSEIGGEGSENKTYIINCVFEVQNFCDVFVNLFKTKQPIKHAKVVVIKEGVITIYEEKFEVWDKMSMRELFDRAEALKSRTVSNDNNSKVNLGSFEQCFTALTQYDVGEFKSMKLVDADKLHLKRNVGGSVVFEIVDDMSYIMFKEALKIKEEFDEFDNN